MKIEILFRGQVLAVGCVCDLCSKLARDCEPLAFDPEQLACGECRAELDDWCSSDSGEPLPSQLSWYPEVNS